MKSRHLWLMICVGLLAGTLFMAGPAGAANETLLLSIGTAPQGGTATALLSIANTADIESFSLLLSFASGTTLTLKSPPWLARSDYFPSVSFSTEELNDARSPSAGKVYLTGFKPSGTSGAVGSISFAVSGQAASGDQQVLSLSGEFFSKSEKTVKQFLDTSATFTVGTPVNQYAVSASVSGGHGTAGPASQSVNENGTATITITPDTGYYIATITDNGASMPVTNPYVINNVTAAHNVVVTFTLSSYTVTPSAGTGGTITPSTPQTVNYGATKSFAVTPNPGYYIAGITGCGGSLAGNTYTTGPITANCTVTASFGASQYVVTPQAGPNGSISPSTPQTVAYGARPAFAVTPSNGYMIASVTGCGGSLSGNTYTTGPITASCTVSASFAVLTERTVTPQTGPHGAISPATPQKVAYNATRCFTVTPDACYRIDTVTGCGGSLNGSQYCTGPVTADCTVSATFALTTYTVTASAPGGHGTVTPPTQNVNCGASATITITPETKYHIAQITDNGVVQSTRTSPYIIANVQTMHDVVVSFSNTHTVTVEKQGSGDGTVTSFPKGLTCGATCTYEFPADKRVTLTAKPASDSVFAGWGGNCSGTRTCVLTMKDSYGAIATFKSEPDILVTPALKNFGNLASGKTRQTVFTIKNKGKKPLSITKIGFAGMHFDQFTKKTDPCTGASIAPNGTCRVTILFAPTSGGVKAAALSIQSNDPDTPTMEIALSGNGLSVSAMAEKAEGVRCEECVSVTGSDGFTYVRSRRKLVAYDAEGNLRWFIGLPEGGVESKPTLGADGSVYVGSGSTLMALDPEGAVKWEYETSGPMSLGSPALGNDGSAYVGAKGGLYALASDGSERWVFESDADFGWSTPLVATDRRIYVGARGSKAGLYAFSEDGALLWHFPTADQPAGTSPVQAGDGTVYFGTTAALGTNYLYAMTPDGAVTWAFAVDNWCSSPSVGPEDTVWVGSGSGMLYAVKPTGETRWSVYTGYSINDAPIIGKGGEVRLQGDAALQVYSPEGTLMVDEPPDQIDVPIDDEDDEG